MEPLFDRVCIIGVGLLGGSIGMALKSHHVARQVIGLGRDKGKLQRGVELGAIDSFALSMDELPKCDLIIACVPVQRIPAVLQEAAARMPQALLTDVGSTKKTIVDQMKQANLQDRFIGSHPMAGSHHGGVEHATSDLLNHRKVIVTPTELTPSSVLDRVLKMWESLGAKTISLSPEDHDRAVAEISHLPHLVASILAGNATSSSLEVAASGWSSATRLAKGDPSLWREIVEENQDAILETLKSFQAHSLVIARLIETKKFDELQAFLERANKAAQEF